MDAEAPQFPALTAQVLMERLDPEDFEGGLYGLACSVCEDMAETHPTLLGFEADDAERTLYLYFAPRG
jgi:hypothetical protein